jgi:uncharacterized protein
MSNIQRIVLIACGTLSAVLGVIGIFVPILPTTPFLLLAAFLYARSSPRLLHVLLGNRWLGAYIRNYGDGRGIPLRMKMITIAGLWATIGMTVLWAVSVVWLQLALIAIAVAVTVHLLRIKTLRVSKGGAPVDTTARAEVAETEEG